MDLQKEVTVIEINHPVLSDAPKYLPVGLVNELAQL